METAPTFHAPPTWVAGRTWYQLFALGAAGAPTQNPALADPAAAVAHRFDRLTAWLDHVADLGAGGVLLSPIFASCSHGYDTIDPFRIDPRLGDDADVDRFLAAAHERDLRVLFDGVLNHVSRAFPPFVDVLAHGPHAPGAAWFHLDAEGSAAHAPDGFTYRCFEGHHDLVTLDHASPVVLDWAVAVARHWLDRGIDGWRLDAAYAVPRPFWAAFSAQVRAGHPDAELVGEVIHGDYAGFVADTGLDSVTQYELWKATWSSINDRNLFELAWALQRHAGFCEAFVPLTFVGNHDVTRLVSRLDDPWFVGHAVALLTTVPGSPCIYYGDELGWAGLKEERVGGDDAVRPALPDSALPADDAAAGLLDVHRRLLALRRARPWLTTGSLDVVATANESLQYTVTARPTAAGGVLLVVLNLADHEVAIAAADPGSGRAWQVVEGSGTPTTAAPRSWLVLEAR